MFCVPPKKGAAGRVNRFAWGMHRAHRRVVIRLSAPMRSLSAFVLLAALVARMLVPAGWMPSTDRAFAITVCTGIDTQTVWLDTQGKTHKQDPSKADDSDHEPCTFAGGAFASLTPEMPAVETAVAYANAPVFAHDSIAPGQGLAAPPPPSTGPPSLI